ncbi:hypothetical protein BYT27DRAFT_6835036 [Phlegmacium glaucopus]|nr:hypothetical protein BYT27DRAFT_6835036 [Phlegmacium glaucopus]
MSHYFLTLMAESRVIRHCVGLDLFFLSCSFTIFLINGYDVRAWKPGSIGWSFRITTSVYLFLHTIHDIHNRISSQFRHTQQTPHPPLPSRKDRIIFMHHYYGLGSLGKEIEIWK